MKNKIVAAISENVCAAKMSRYIREKKTNWRLPFYYQVLTPQQQQQVRFQPPTLPPICRRCPRNFLFALSCRVWKTRMFFFFQ
jgi:hypothetical protein